MRAPAPTNTPNARANPSTEAVPTTWWSRIPSKPSHEKAARRAGQPSGKTAVAKEVRDPSCSVSVQSKPFPSAMRFANPRFTRGSLTSGITWSTPTT